MSGYIVTPVSEEQAACLDHQAATWRRAMDVLANSIETDRIMDWTAVAAIVVGG
jgi:hypothetical protein